MKLASQNAKSDTGHLKVWKGCLRPLFLAAMPLDLRKSYAFPLAMNDNFAVPPPPVAEPQHSKTELSEKHSFSAKRWAKPRD